MIREKACADKARTFPPRPLCQRLKQSSRRCTRFSAVNLKQPGQGEASEANGREETVESTLSSLEAFLRPDAPVNVPPQTAEGTSSVLPQQVSVPIGPIEKEKEVVRKLFDGSKPILRELRDTPPSELFRYGRSMAVKQMKDFLKPTHIVDENFVLPRVEPRVSYLILLLNIAVYAYGLSLRFSEGEDGPIRYFNSLANINAGIEGGEYYRLLTSNFLHDSFVHLAVSSYALFTIAPEAESILGVSAFLTTYVLGGVAGASLCFLLTDVVTVGASAGIFGLIGALGAFLYKNHRAPQASDQVLFATGTLLFNLFLGGNHETAVDNLGHLGSLVCGAYLGMLLTPYIITKDAAAPDIRAKPRVDQPAEPGTAFPVDLAREAKKRSLRQQKKSEASVEQNPAEPVVIQPNPVQSFIVLVCVSITLASGVAATVLHRTGQLPMPRWPVF